MSTETVNTDERKKLLREIEILRLQLKTLAPYARRGLSSVTSWYGNDLAAHLILLELEKSQ